MFHNLFNYYMARYILLLLIVLNIIWQLSQNVMDRVVLLAHPKI